MRHKHLLTTLFLLLAVPLAALAQYWESGTQKTNNFYNYTSGGTQYQKTEVWYDINAEQDGKMEFGSTPLGDVKIDVITLYAVDGDDQIWVSGGSQSLVVEDVAAGLYRVSIKGHPTDRNGQGGNFIVSYVLYPADYVNDPEPNDTWERAYQIESGDPHHGHLGYKRGGYRDTEDWYMIQVPDEGVVTFTTHASSKLRLGYLGMYTPNNEGTGTNFRNDKWMDANGNDTTIVYTIPDVAPGLYYVRLRHYSGYGSYKLNYSFTANPYGADTADNNTWDKAVDMALDTPTDGRLGYHYNGDTDGEDWFKIMVPEEGKLTFLTKTETTLRMGYLGMYTLNDNGTGVDFRNDKWMDANGKDSTVVYEVPDVSIGTYYVRVRRYSGYGGYTLSCYFTSHAAEADPEPNNNWNDPEVALLKSGPAITGQLGYTFNGDTDVEDWYHIEVPKEGSVVFSTKSESTLRLGYLGMYTLDGKGTGMDFRNDKWMDAEGQDTTLVYTVNDVAPGTYYVRLRRYSGYGTYTMQYIHNPNTHENDPEKNDTWDKATLIKSGTTQQGCLGYHFNGDTDGEDWFMIELPDEGKVTLATTTETTLRLGYVGMYTPNEEGTGTNFRNDKWMDAEGRDTTLVYTVPNCKPGLYYVRVRRYSGYGGYDLDYTFTANSHGQDNPDNDTWDKATLVENNATQQGRLGYHYNDDTDGEDWFKIEVPDEGTVTLATTTETTLRLGYVGMYVPNEEGTGTNFRNDTWMNGEGKDSTVVYTVPGCKPGLYYVRVRRYSGYGGYKLDYNFKPNVYGPDFADNDTFDKATTLEIGSTQQGRLGFNYLNDTDGEDWYEIDVPYVGNLKLTVGNESTLRLGYVGLYIPNEEGTGTSFITDKWMDAGGKDSTIVYNINARGAGKYYVRVRRYSGYGGYSLKYEFERNPWDRDNIQNGTFATRYKLEEGKTVSTTMGYTYRKQNNEDWYDLGMMHGRQIDVTLWPDTTHTLIIGVPALYIYKGDKENGDPILENVASSRIERSRGTISYLDKHDEDQHFVFRVPNYNNSSYGGYTITFGDPEEEEGSVSSDIAVMTGGRNTVRKGVPCENPITISNLSDQPSDFFMLVVEPTDDVNIIGFRMPVGGTSIYLPVDSVTIPGMNTCVFVVPKMLPWESYTFTMISEGVGDISYARDEAFIDANSRDKVIILGTAVTVAAVGAFAKTAAVGLAVGFAIDWFSKKAGDAIFPADSEAATQYANLMGATKEQLGIRSSWDSPVVYTAKSFVGTCTTEATKKIVPKTGTFLDVVGNTITALQNIIPNLRRRIWYWIYKDLGYFDNNGLEVLDGKQAITDVVASWDPNEMVGPQGIGDNHYIGETQTVNYRILFENKAEAGAAAYRVRISDELDENVFDVSTVRFGETSHDGVGYNWVTKREGNKLSWDIQGIELPPNVNAPEGEGYVSFSVDLKPGLADGTKLKNKATIIFDKNTPIETNEFVNTLDLTPPMTVMASADYDPSVNTIRVQFQSKDVASGVQSYLLFVSHNGGEYAYCGQSVLEQMDYTVENYVDGDNYSFYVLAIDNVGNVEHVVPQVVQAITGISNVRFEQNVTLRIYTTDGRYMGDNPTRLPKGVYVIGGKKFVVK